MSNKSLIVAAAICLVGGSGLFYTSKRMKCVPLIDACVFVTSGTNIFDMEGVEVSPALANSVEPAAYGVLGLGGIALLAGLVRPTAEKQ